MMRMSGLLPSRGTANVQAILRIATVGVKLWNRALGTRGDAAWLDNYTGQVSSRYAESQNTRSSWVARAKAVCIRLRKYGEALSAASSVAATTSRTAAWNSSP